MMSYYKKPTLLFETIKIKDGVGRNLDFHLKRMQNSAVKKITFDIAELLKAPKNGLLRAKLIYDEDGNFIKINYFDYTKREISSLKLLKSELNYEKKYLNRDEIEKLFAMRAGCDDIIIIKNGIITDTSIANIAVKFDEIWYTPKSPLLTGTTRARLIESGFLHERDFSASELKSASKFGLMNAMVGFCEFEIIWIHDMSLGLRAL